MAMIDLGHLSYKGIAYGLGFYAVASIALILLVTFSYLALVGNEGFEESFPASLTVRIIFLLGGLLTTFGVGYCAVLFSQSSSMLNPLLTGFILLIFQGTWVAYRPDSAPTWSQATVLAGSIPLALLGGYFAANT